MGKPSITVAVSVVGVAEGVVSVAVVAVVAGVDSTVEQVLESIWYSAPYVYNCRRQDIDQIDDKSIWHTLVRSQYSPSVLVSPSLIA